ncbi:MAG: TonB-dependent receptor [Pseudomonadota bacterium]
MINKNVLKAGVAALALGGALSPLSIAPSAHAQQITSEIRGFVTDANGAPISGASVTITDTRTGASRTTTSGSDGEFNARNLTTGGPYTVRATAPGRQAQIIEDVFLNLNAATTVSLTLNSGAESDDAIVVTATRSNAAQLAIGPSSTFNLETIEALPSISRDIRDIIRVDPRLTVTGGDNQVSCNGANNRFNSFTIDGVNSNDSFGLNASGTPARANFPIPFDAIREASVEFSPYDVEYGQFTGCNINIVTKGGSNEFHGAAFAVFNSASLTGDFLGDRNVQQPPFRDYNWGASIGGPVIKDKFFVYVAYEEIDDAGNIFGDGPEDADPAFANPVSGLTEAEANEAADIARSIYGFEPGEIPRTGIESSRRILARGDYFFNDNHRLEFTYSREREAEVESDFFGGDFQFANSQEISGSRNNFYSARLFNQWTDNFTTQLWASRRDNTDIQNPVGGGEAQDPNPIPILLVDVGADDLIQVAGPGIFRSANDLQTQTDQIKMLATYNAGSHVFTGGYEYNNLSVFNLFAPRSTGVFEFASLDDFRNGIASEVRANGNGGDINDAAASFERNIHSLYFQDEWSPTDALSVTLGLRYDYYASPDAPRPSAPFQQRYGFSNAATTFDGLGVLQPRLGINYDAGATIFGETQFRAGAGVFSGGDPTVWLSNLFSNDGIGLSDQRVSRVAACAASDLQVLDGGTFTGIPQCLRDAQLAQTTLGNGRVDALDPDFNIPSLVRGSFGFTHFFDFGGAAGGFFDDWTMNVDLIYAQRRNAPEFRELSFSQTGQVFPDGRTAVQVIDPLNEGCNATFVDSRTGFTGDLTNCISSRRQQDILLTNTEDGGSQLSISAAFQKRFDYELFDRPARVNVNVGYAFTDATDRQGTVSSQATSNFEETVRAVSTQTILAPSQFSNRHNITLATSFTQEFLPDLPTAFSFFVTAREGRPFSFVFDNPGIFGELDREDNILAYIPVDENDPLVDFSGNSAEDQFAFFNFLSEVGLSDFAGQVGPRNAFRDPWFVDVDFRFQQDVPMPVDWLRSVFYIDIENVLNLIDSDANLLETFDRGDVGEGVPLARIGLNQNGQYTFSNLATGPDLEIASNASLWSVQFGLRFEF